ncbi:MAG: immunoglobulin domain-containing protein [Opitutaceae bacterium]|nr:immunoglobulin domain-containing protein [Opitutaceae bacterium]
MTLLWLQIKFARAQVSIFMLAMLLQRTPVIKYMMQFEKAATAPIAKMIRAFTVTAASLGGLHSLSGATEYVINPASPASSKVGEEFALAFDVDGAPGGASSWRITGDIPPGMAIDGLVGNNINTEDSVTITGTPTTVGSYNITIKPFNGTNQTRQTWISTTITINVAEAPNPPEIVWHPRSMTVSTGGRAQFFFEASGEMDTVQWLKDEVPIGGESGSTLILAEATLSDAGVYTVSVSNEGSATISEKATLTIDDSVAGSTVSFTNEGFMTPGSDVLFLTLVIEGASARTILLRGLGPALEGANASGFLADPQLELIRSIVEDALEVDTQALLSNDDWEVDQNAVELAAALSANGKSLESGSKDAAILVTLAEGSYTIKFSGKSEWMGIGLAEMVVVE